MGCEKTVDEQLRGRILLAIRRTFPVEGEAIEGEAGRLSLFLQLLVEANSRMNLVSRRAAEGATLVERHLVDSLRGLALLPRGGARRLLLVDVGTGGGFPAIPLLIVRKDLDGVLFESTKKKATFLEATTRELGLTATVVNARFPDPNEMKKIPKMDVLTTRAVSGGGGLFRAARIWMAPGAIALCWTTRPLLEGIRRDSGLHRVHLHETPGTEQAGIAVLERST
jgi:16S rRNA (guanine527-N7)-methyltransferase